MKKIYETRRSLMISRKTYYLGTEYALKNSRCQSVNVGFLQLYVRFGSQLIFEYRYQLNQLSEVNEFEKMSFYLSVLNDFFSIFTK